METFLLRIQLSTENPAGPDGPLGVTGSVTHVASGHESSFVDAEELIAQLELHLDPSAWRERRPS